MHLIISITDSLKEESYGGGRRGPGVESSLLPMLPKWHPAFSILGNIGIGKNWQKLKYLHKFCLNGTKYFIFYARIALAKMRLPTLSPSNALT